MRCGRKHISAERCYCYCQRLLPFRVYLVFGNVVIDNMQERTFHMNKTSVFQLNAAQTTILLLSTRFSFSASWFSHFPRILKSLKPHWISSIKSIFIWFYTNAFFKSVPMNIWYFNCFKMLIIIKFIIIIDISTLVCSYSC